MSSKEQTCIGTVVYNNQEFMPIAKVVHGEESSLTSNEMCVPYDSDNHWAYLIVGYEECKELRASSQDNQTLLDELKSTYAPMVKTVISSKKKQISGSGEEYNNKLIYHKISKVKTTTSLQLFLKSTKYTCQAKKIENKKEALKSRMYLEISTQKAYNDLQNEYNHFHKRARVKPKLHPFAFVGVPYTFNKDEVVINDSAVFVSLMPKVQFEAGVFFDGTLNNMYNTNLRVDFENYTQTQIDFLNGVPLEGIPTNGPKAILNKLSKDEVLKAIQNDLKQSINFYKNGARDDKLKEYIKKSAKGASKELYDYFQNILEKKGGSVEEFVKEKLLPDKGSYQNDKSNIAILHSLYDTNIKESESKGYFFRKSIYVTGAGSYNPYLDQEHKGDALVGKALGIGETGVLAKVNQACQFIKESITEFGYIDSLVLDVFGFSRGAAEARHFVNAIANELDVKLKKDNGEFVLYKKDGSNLYPLLLKEIEGKKDEVIIDKIIFRFVGVFDTVPHYGLSQENDAKEDLKLFFDDSKISNVLHLVAKDEFRENFALTKLKSSAKHFEERAFHGAHSDIGGGYVDGEAEKVLLHYKSDLDSSRYKTEKKKILTKLKKWNKKYNWLNKEKFSEGLSIDIEDGFFMQKIPKFGRRNERTYTMRLWMIRSSISSEYAKLPLEYMHKKLLELKLPFKNLSLHNKLTDKKLSDNKQKILNLDEKVITSIRAEYFHHSSDLYGVGMEGTDPEDNSEFYGKRVVYKN